jgi:DNA-binding winged helix-turn-helix (wHTH) protein
MAIAFGDFTLDDRTRQLLRGGAPVHLSPKAYDLLAMLVRTRPDAQSKDDIHRFLWPDSFVSDGNLAVLVTEIREALHDEARHPQFVRTVHSFGYAFCGSAMETRAISAAPVMCWLIWQTGRVPLAPGRHIIGRDPSADVRIDAVGVSRRHASIAVTDQDVTVEDLGSKNGTFVNGRRVTGAAPLADGTEIGVGAVTLTFRRVANPASTQSLG